MLSKICINDPAKMSRICADQGNINVHLTWKSIKQFKRGIKNIEKNPSFNSSEKIRFTQILRDGLTAKESFSSDEVLAAACASYPNEKKDHLYLLHSAKTMMERGLASPITPLELSFGKCQKLLQKSFLLNLQKPDEILNDLAKKELRILRASNATKNY